MIADIVTDIGVLITISVLVRAVVRQKEEIGTLRLHIQRINQVNDETTVAISEMKTDIAELKAVRGTPKN